VKKMEKLVVSNWRITGMEVWDADIDLFTNLLTSEA